MGLYVGYMGIVESKMEITTMGYIGLRVRSNCFDSSWGQRLGWLRS